MDFGLEIPIESNPLYQERVKSLEADAIPNYVVYLSNDRCGECGAVVRRSERGQHTNFHSNFIHRSEVEAGFAVSAVKWCDMGNHAFKASAPGSQSLDVTQRDSNGENIRVQMDICGEHSFVTDDNSRRMKIEAALHNEG